MTELSQLLGSWTYLTFELVWAWPVILLHWALGAPALLAVWRRLAAAVAVATVYLSLADSIAISQGIWTISPERSVGILVGNLPIEEIVFFLVTNLMVAQTVVLAGDTVTLRRFELLLQPRRPE